MKKITLYMMMLLVGFISMNTLTSCLGDEEEETVIDDAVRDQYIKDIVGYWQLDKTNEFWRFDADGNVTRIAINGEYWDEDDDIYEGWTGTNKFNWSINEVGMLSILIQLESSEAIVPDPDRFLIKSITSTKMTWVTNEGNGKQQTLTRRTKDEIKHIAEDE